MRWPVGGTGISAGPVAGLDIIGDLHGEWGALEALIAELGYTPGWRHPQGRRLVFLGDLVDRGAASLRIAMAVAEACTDGRAHCIMGNHEYNLVAWWHGIPGVGKARSSNRDTVALISQDRGSWAPVMAFFEGLPIALQAPGLRIIHAVWHQPSIDAVASVLGGEGGRFGVRTTLGSPFVRGALHPDLPPAGDGQDDAPHELLMKGYEVAAQTPFLDNDGALRDRIRATWWSDPMAPVPQDGLTVFGHYWNLPPIDGNVAPAFPSGHPNLRRWANQLAPRVPPTGRHPTDAAAVCVDFNGWTKARPDTACAGALRWPEREIVWAVAPRSVAGGH